MVMNHDKLTQKGKIKIIHMRKGDQKNKGGVREHLWPHSYFCFYGVSLRNAHHQLGTQEAK